DANASAKAKTATLTFRAALDAPPDNHPFRLRILETDESNATKKSFATRSFLTGTSRGDYLVNETEWLHLTVKPAPPPKKKKEEKEAEKEEEL
ncbi:MAG: hypothetical protein VB997_03400, partial [Opitutales bacterium]